MRFRVIVSVGRTGDPTERIELLHWVVTRLIDALRDSPIPVTVTVEQDP